MECPKCGQPLTQGTYESREAFMCESCKGVLIHQKDTIPILQRLSKDLINTISLDTPIESTPPRNESLSCPFCQGKMESHGYMGSNKVIVNNCSRCWLLWLDPSELGAMSLMYARTQKLAEHLSSMSGSYSADIVTAHRFNSAVSTAFVLGFIVG